MITTSKVGTALKFPPELQNGKAVIVDNADTLRQSIIDLLTQDEPTFFIGERRSIVGDLLFEPNDNVLKAGLERRIKNTLKIWESRVSDISLQFEIQEDKINILIEYRIVGTTKTDSFVYPFYRNLKF